MTPVTTKTNHGSVLETDITDDDLRRVHDDPDDTVLPEPTGYSKTIMAAYRRAKTVTESENIKSRAIVAELKGSREAKDAFATHTEPKPLYAQGSLLDY